MEILQGQDWKKIYYKVEKGEFFYTHSKEGKLETYLSAIDAQRNKYQVTMRKIFPRIQSEQREGYVYVTCPHIFV